MEGTRVSAQFYNCKLDIANDPIKLKDLVKRVREQIDMKPLGPCRAEKGAEHLPGWSCFQLIETSHIALHGFAEGKKAPWYMFNVESCKPFDARELKEFMLHFIVPKTVKWEAKEI